jgi:hypothetical protein
VKLIFGYFDPLYSEHVLGLRQECNGDSQIVVAVDEPPSPVLPWRARAELVAGLSCVDCVIPASLAPSVPDATVVDQRETDLRRTASLERHIAERQKTT